MKRMMPKKKKHQSLRTRSFYDVNPNPLIVWEEIIVLAEADPILPDYVGVTFSHIFCDTE